MVKIQIIFYLILCFFVLSCNSQNLTPESFKNYSVVGKKIYQRNQTEIKESIEKLIKLKQEPFHPNENDSLTEIYVDTILYSPKKDKYASFIIIKNSNEKLIDKGNKNDYHYNAYCFIGKLNGDLDINDMTWVRGHILFNYKSIKNASIRMREIYFKEITLRTNKSGESTYKYNLDDIRFWNGPVWNRYY